VWVCWCVWVVGCGGGVVTISRGGCGVWAGSGSVCVYEMRNAFVW